jgi:hypothetical protein
LEFYGKLEFVRLEMQDTLLHLYVHFDPSYLYPKFYQFQIQFYVLVSYYWNGENLLYILINLISQ